VGGAKIGMNFGRSFVSFAILGIHPGEALSLGHRMPHSVARWHHKSPQTQLGSKDFIALFIFVPSNILEIRSYWHVDLITINKTLFASFNKSS